MNIINVFKIYQNCYPWAPQTYESYGLIMFLFHYPLEERCVRSDHFILWQ